MDGAGRSPWRHWFPLTLLLGILALAPAVANAQSPGSDSVSVRWTAPGDDGGLGTATTYDLRVSVNAITAANFDQALQVPGVPSPGPAGTLEHAVVRGLTQGTTYYFAIKTSDENGNWSTISNLLRYDWTLDTSPPLAPRNVTANLEGTSVRVRWSANTEADLQGYKVYRTTTSGGTFQPLVTSPLQGTEYLDVDLPSGTKQVWYRLTALDVSNNESAPSTTVTLSLVGQTGGAATVDLVVQAGYPNPSDASSPVHVPVVVPASGATHASAEIQDSGSRTVRHIDLGTLAAGPAEVVWDGKNDAGRICAPGVYRCWVITPTQRQSVRIVRTP